MERDSDGAHWDDWRQGRRAHRKRDVLVPIGYVSSLLFWPLGIIIGIILAGRRNDHGPVILSISVVVAIGIGLSFWGMG